MEDQRWDGFKKRRDGSPGESLTFRNTSKGKKKQGGGKGNREGHSGYEPRVWASGQCSLYQTVPWRLSKYMGESIERREAREAERTMRGQRTELPRQAKLGHGDMGSWIY